MLARYFLIETTLDTNLKKARWASVLSSPLRSLPAEFAHRLGIMAMKSKVTRLLPRPDKKYLDHLNFKTTVRGMGLLEHPVMLAAGFDKNAECLTELFDLGFSGVEVGTITPRPQAGNPKPRLFRLKDQRAIINRMGFNSDGATSVFQRLRHFKKQHDQQVVGVNVGKNKQTANSVAIDDYLSSMELFADFCDYLVVNISSPNTPNLRELASPEFVKSLSYSTTHCARTWIKLDPDLSKKQLQVLIEAIADGQFAGVILTNTHKVNQPEPGGLSGHPLLSRSNQFLEWAHEVHQGSLEMIAVGGVFSGIDVFEKLARGASAVQIYSSFVYRGPFVVHALLAELWQEMQSKGIDSVEDCIGYHYKE